MDVDPKLATHLGYEEGAPPPIFEDGEKVNDWFQGLNLHNIEVLYVFGVFCGEVFQAAKKWLKESPSHHLVFLEDHQEVLQSLFLEEVGTKILEHAQVHLHHSGDGIDPTVSYWDFRTTKVAVVPHPNQKDRERFEELEQQILFDTATKNALVEEYLKYGAGFFKNFYPNIRLLADSYWGNTLFKKYKNVPAVICGAGPSLEKSIPFLKTLKKRALIFAGGSAVTALDSAGVEPHFGAGIDPNPEQYSRFTDTTFSAPFFYRSRMYHPAFEQIKGPKLYISGTGGYDVSDWFEEKFGIDQEFLDEGHNVVNFCTELATRMGCNPIIFVGLDLAFTGMQLYAPGVVGDSSISEEELVTAEDIDAKGILREDIHGKPTYTLWKWIAEADWLQTFANDHPETTLLNATEGGLGIPDVANVTMQNILEEYLKKTISVEEQIQEDIKAATMPQVTKEKIDAALEELGSSLKRCQEHLTTLIEEAPKSGLAALAETELSEEPGFTAILDVFNATYSLYLNKEFSQIKKEQDLDKQEIAKQELNKKRFHFLRDVAAANLILMEQ